MHACAGRRRLGGACALAEGNAKIDVVCLATRLNLVVVWLEEGSVAGRRGADVALTVTAIVETVRSFHVESVRRDQANIR
jgi:hypothetical protein